MNNYNQIDLNEVKEKIIKFAEIEDTKSFILNEEVSFNPLVIERKLKETKEALLLLKDNFDISFSGIININDLFVKAKKGIILTTNEISLILNFINHTKRIKEAFRNIDNELLIKDYIDSLYINNDLYNKIFKTIDNKGNIKTDASIDLLNISSDLSNYESSLYDKAHDFISIHKNSLQEESTYLRNNRLTLLIKNSDKNKYQGFAYGTSASGQATYVEPGEIVELNNKVLDLKEKQEEEIKKILKALSLDIGEFSDLYIRNFDSLIILESIFTKARYGFNNNGIIAEICDNDLYLKDIAHPLIDENRVIVNTYRLDNKYKGIVISGTNTGGKTVGLKCIGLACVMSYLGIPLIASEAKIPLYDNIYVDIDDNQSILDSLSTFSAHLSNINNILNNATTSSLILIDELISGTDPKEAQAISLSILNKIKEIGSKFIVTTHYDDIKNYALNNEDILLSSVGFDDVNLRPTYKYIEGSVGSSNAIVIAKRYFDDPSIVKFALDVIRKNNSKQEDLLKKLEDEISHNQKLKDEYDKLIFKYNSLNNELESKINEFNLNKQEMKNEYIESLNQYIENIKDEIEKYIDNNNIQNKKDLSKLDKYKENIVYDKEEFKVGDYVKVNQTSRAGVISQINGDKVSVDINGISIKTDINSLSKSIKIEKKEYIPSYSSNKKIAHDLLLVGKHIDEALNELEVFLDDALSNNLIQVKIIHGYGTGQLKNAIREKLKKLSFVKSFTDADFNDGGSGATIVKLK